MRKFILLSVAMFACCGLLLAVTGCRTKLPAGDVDIIRLFAPEVAVLKDPKLSPNSLDKYNAACVIAQNVDFSYLRDIPSMVAIFGTQDATQGSFEGNSFIVYTYKFKNKSIQFRFSVDGEAIINSNVKMIE